jgi:hypothetical protein
MKVGAGGGRPHISRCARGAGVRQATPIPSKQWSSPTGRHVGRYRASFDRDISLDEVSAQLLDGGDRGLSRRSPGKPRRSRRNGRAGHELDACSRSAADAGHCTRIGNRTGISTPPTPAAMVGSCAGVTHPEVMWGDLLSRLAARQPPARYAPVRHGSRRARRQFRVGRRRLALHWPDWSAARLRGGAGIRIAEPWRDVFVSYEATRTLAVPRGTLQAAVRPRGNDRRLAAEVPLYRSNVSFRRSRRDGPGASRGPTRHKRIGYEAGVLHTYGNNARPEHHARSSATQTAAARIVLNLRQVASVLRGLKVGCAAIDGEPLAEGFPSLRGRSLFGTSYYDADVWVRGGRRRPAWRRSGVGRAPGSARSYMRVSDDRHRQSSDNSDLPPLVAQAGTVSGAWTVALPAGGLDPPGGRASNVPPSAALPARRTPQPRACGSPAWQSRSGDHAGPHVAAIRGAAPRQRRAREHRRRGGAVSAPAVWQPVLRLQLSL